MSKATVTALVNETLSSLVLRPEMWGSNESVEGIFLAMAEVELANEGFLVTREVKNSWTDYFAAHRPHRTPPLRLEEWRARFQPSAFTAFLHKWYAEEFPVLKKELLAEEDDTTRFVLSNMKGHEEKIHSMLVDIALAGMLDIKVLFVEQDRLVVESYGPALREMIQRWSRDGHVPKGLLISQWREDAAR